MTPLLSIKDLRTTVEGKEILKGISLEVMPGEIHAIMGPNGSGKSTLVNTLMGHPKYKVTSGFAAFLGKDILKMEPEDRAKLGLFLAFQYPKEIAGVSLRSFLFAAYNAQMQARDPEYKKISPIKFKKILEENMHDLHVNPNLSERPLNQGFSGGEKKKAEVLQLKILKPALALLDETDSGLDIDALKIVAEGVNSLKISSPSQTVSLSIKDRNLFSAIIVTHYARILSYIQPDKVHVMVNGEIVESGGSGLAEKLEDEGYKKYGVNEALSINLHTE